jgi:hypothetical protein
MATDDVDEPIDAQQMTEELRRYHARIPSFTHLTNEQIIVLRKAATLDPRWVEEAINVLAASPAMAGIIGASYHELREETEDLGRWSGVETEVYSLLKGIAAANLIRRHRIGSKALQIYGIARQLVRQPEYRDALLTHVLRLQEMNKLGRRKKKTPA